MSWMFENCKNLTEIDLSGVDTSHVISMSALFYDCEELQTISGLDTFDTSNVVNMSYMFLNCYKLPSLDLRNFDTSKVNSMDSMFYHCKNLTSLNVSSFDTSNVTTMWGMFCYCENLISLDLSNFVTSKVTQMEDMFSGCYSLTSLDLSSFDTSLVTNMSYMFSSCENLETLNVSSFDTGNVTNMNSMFRECYKLEELDISSFDTANVEGMYLMFTDSDALNKIKLGENFTVWHEDGRLPEGNWKHETKNLSMTAAQLQSEYPANASTWAGWWTRDFAYAILRSDGDLIFTRSAFYYENESVGTLTDLKGRTFTGTIYNGIEDEYFYPYWSSDQIIRVYAVDTIKPKTMQYWFNYAVNLVSFDASNFDTSECTSMYCMFRYCSNLEQIDLHTFDTSKVTSMNCLFAGDTKLRQVNVSGFDTSQVTDMSWMFSDCFSLEALDLSSFDTGNVTDMYDMLYRCNSLTEVKLGSKWTKWISDYSALPNEGTWENAALGLIMSAEDLYEQYPANAAAWSGTWKRRLVYAVLTDDKDLVFVRSNGIYTNSYYESVERIDGGAITGIVFTNVENYDGSYPNYSPWYSYRDDIKAVYALDEIKPLTTKYWFSDCINLESFDAANFNTSYTTDMEAMFDHCEKLKELDLSSFDTSMVTSMHSMFYDCNQLETLNISAFNTANVKEFTYMFYECEKLKELDLSSFDTSKATSLYCMFSYCESLEELDLSNFNTPKLNSGYSGMDYLFYGCTSLKKLDLSSFDTSSVSEMIEVFDCCNALEEIALGPKWTKWLDNSYLPSGTWSNGVLFKSETELYNEYPENAQIWQGTWKKVDPWGDITNADDRAKYSYDVTLVPSGLWMSELGVETYTGKAITQDFRVYDGRKLLTLNTDYTVKYANNIKAGTATVTITGKGNYQGTLTDDFMINPADLTMADVTLNKDYFAYNTKVQKASVTSVVLNGVKLKANTDYTIEYRDSLDNKVDPKISGDYKVLVKGKGNYTGSTIPVIYHITDLIPVNTLKITGIKNYSWTGLPIEQPDIVVKDSKKNDSDHDGVLEKGVEYYVVCTNNVDAGTATVTIYGDDTTYVGFLTKTFKITGTAISKAKVSGIDASYAYTGADIKPLPIITYNGATLVEGTDYTLSYDKNVDIGTATLTINGKGGYTGSVKKTYKISGTAFNAKDISLINFLSSVTYNGAEIRQDTVTLRDLNTHTDLLQDVDYTISYKNNIKVGTATMTFKGLGKYSGSFNKTFKITKGKIVSDSITMASSYTYTKGGTKPIPSVIVDGRKLVLNSDYTLSYKNNTKQGTATVTVKGKGNYEGSVTRSFTITASDVSKLTMTASDKVKPTKAVSMSTAITITDKNGVKLTAGTDYDKNIVYTYAENVVLDDGTARYLGEEVQKADTNLIPVKTTINATVSLKGNYSDTISQTFRIVKGDLSKAKVSIRVQYYTGMPLTLLDEDIVVKIGSSVLKKDVDYEIVSYNNNKDKGTASVIIKGIGEYGGNKTASFKIVQRSFGVVVRFYGNGATSGTMKDQLIYKGGVRLNKNTFKKTGKSFGYWSLTPDGSIKFADQEVFPYALYDRGSAIILYAIWQ